MLRVATLNIWNRSGPWEERLRSIRRELEEKAFDIVALQEVLAAEVEGERWDQAELIASGLGYSVHRASHPEADFPLGNAILSRFPLVQSWVWHLPHVETEQRRTLVGALLEGPKGVKIPVFSTHLNWRLDEGHVREKQMIFVAEKIREVAHPGMFPAILMGDFNADPDSDEIRYLRGLTTLGEPQRVYFTDVWTYLRPAEFGETFARRNPYAAVYREPDRRIDYIFVRGPDDSGYGEPLAVERCFDTPSADGVFPSDHFGVSTTLRGPAAI